MSPYTHTLALHISSVHQEHITPEQGAEAIADLFADWPIQRRKELYDILAESIKDGMAFTRLVAAIDEALFINAQDWQSTKH